MEYPWYELIDSCDEITQGDIVMQCPVPIIKTDNEVISGSTISADIEMIDGIILTQGCDIANRKIDNIIKKTGSDYGFVPLTGSISRRRLPGIL